MLAAAFAVPASAEVYNLVTGVAPGMAPGAYRPVTSSPGGLNGFFNDGQRLAGTAAAAVAPYLGTGSTGLFAPNQFGSTSFMFRRGSAPGMSGLQPVMVVDFLGGPLLDLDGNAGNGSRSLTPVPGQTPVALPGTSSHLDLTFGASSVSLNNFDATGTNQGFPGFGADITLTVNTLGGTQPNGTLGAPINPAVDTRAGTASATATPGVTRIQNLGYEFWQDGTGFGSTSSTLGTLQYLGGLNGFRIERDGNGDFPTLAGLLGTTPWAAVNTADVGRVVNTTVPAFPTTSITTGPAADNYTAPGNGGLPLTSYTDLGAYLDAVVVPTIHSFSQSFVYLDSVGFGVNNSFDPTFTDTVGYDVVLIAQAVPEPTALGLLALGGMMAAARRARRA
jgi:hypothetical protein